jgi:hypothetical protein
MARAAIAWCAQSVAHAEPNLRASAPIALGAMADDGTAAVTADDFRSI